LVEGFKRIVERDKVSLEPPAVQNARQDGLHVPIALLRSISRVKATNKRAKITANLLSAAMHIAFLRSAASNNGLCDLPESAQALMIQYEKFQLLDARLLNTYFLATPLFLNLPRTTKNSSAHLIPGRRAWEVSATIFILWPQYRLCISYYQTIYPQKTSIGRH